MAVDCIVVTPERHGEDIPGRGSGQNPGLAWEEEGHRERLRGLWVHLDSATAMGGKVGPESPELRMMASGVRLFPMDKREPEAAS